MAAAIVEGNFAGRCIDNSLRRDSSALSLPVRSFFGEKDEGSKQFLRQQDQNARNEAISKGYKNISIRQIAGKDHGPLPDEVLDYFLSLIMQKKE